MADIEDVLSLLREFREEITGKIDHLTARLDAHGERLDVQRERLDSIENMLDMLRGGIIRLDGNQVEAMALLRILERQDRRIKALEEAK